MDLKLIVRGLWDRIGGWSLIALGALALLLGWVGVSGTPLPSEQIPYVVSGGLAGLGLIGVGATMLISADLRDEWRKLDDIEALLRDPETPASVVVEEPQSEAPGPPRQPRQARRKASAATDGRKG